MYVSVNISIPTENRDILGLLKCTAIGKWHITIPKGNKPGFIRKVARYHHIIMFSKLNYTIGWIICLADFRNKG